MFGLNNKSINECVEEYAELCIAQSYFSETVVNFHVDVEKGNIVIRFSNLSLPDVEKYLMHMGNNLIKRHFGYIEDADKTFYRDSFPFGLSEGELVCDENDEPKELIVPITPEVALNLNRLVISEIHRNVESRMLVNLKEEGKSQEKAVEILKQIRLMPVDKSLPYGCRIRINDSSLVDDYIENFEYLMYKRHGQSRDLKFYKFSKKDKSELSFINMDNSAFIDGVKKGMIKKIARDFRTSGIIEEPKIENLKDAIAKLIFECTGKVVKGFDIVQHTERDDNFSLVPLVKLNGQTRFLSREDKVRFNLECKKNGLGDNVLTDIYIKDKGKVPTFSREGLFALVPKLMKFPIGYNETSKRFEYTVNLGLQQCKSREHYDLKDDLYRILFKFYKDGYLDKKGLLKANSYISSCILDSGFGLDGYDMPELVEFVDKKIKELLSANRAIPQAANSSSFLGVSHAMIGSKSSLSSGNSDSSSRSVSPMPRNSSDSSLSSGPSSMPFFGANCVDDLATAGTSASVAHKRSDALPPLDEMSGEYGKCSGVEVVSKDPSSQQEPHGLHNEKTSTELKAPKLTAVVKEAQENCSIS